MSTTTERGYGWEHQQARAQALRDLCDGEPCPYCDGPMTRVMRLDYDHYPPLALGGGGTRRLTHASCNRRQGQALGVALTRAREAPDVVNSRVW